MAVGKRTGNLCTTTKWRSAIGHESLETERVQQSEDCHTLCPENWILTQYNKPSDPLTEPHMPRMAMMSAKAPMTVRLRE